MRITGLNATVVLRDLKAGQEATLEMTEVELEQIGFGIHGTRQVAILQVQGTVFKKANGSVDFKKVKRLKR